MATSIDIFEAIRVLERLYKEHPAGSDAANAIGMGGAALMFLVANGQLEEFLKSINDTDPGTLSPEQEAHLRKLGLEP